MNTKFKLSALFVVGYLVTGCHNPTPKSMGTPLANAPVVASNAMKTAKGKTVLVKGVMVEKCPVAGCWFKLQDKNGIVKVDTKDAGFVVTDIPLKTEITASGKVQDGDSPTVLATGIRYQ